MSVQANKSFIITFLPTIQLYITGIQPLHSKNGLDGYWFLSSTMVDALLRTQTGRGKI